MRIVLDTNVLISAILFGGVPREILNRCIRGEPRLVLSDTLLDELRGVLRRPRFGLSAHTVQGIVAELAGICDLVTPVTVVSAVADDPSDNAVLECAVDGHADHVVSGDAHLLRLGSYRKIPIVDARQYLGSQLRSP